MKTSLLSFLLLLSVAISTAQSNNSFKKSIAQLSETSIVKDTSGTIYPFSIWNQLSITGRYKFKPENPDNPASAFIIFRIDDEEYEKRMASLPKPKESKFFKTGSSFSYFKATDIEGNKLSSKNLKGKILVLNYWFINCPPCRMEIPELNKLVEQHKGDSMVVFVALALDEKFLLKEFLKTTPFRYAIVDDGRYYAQKNSITSFPTNVVVDQEGKIIFHSSGLSITTAYWLNKTITELKKSVEKDRSMLSQ
jgi:thiol-disulfide isomerase/thioredoxin